MKYLGGHTVTYVHILKLEEQKADIFSTLSINTGHRGERNIKASVS